MAFLARRKYYRRHRLPPARRPDHTAPDASSVLRAVTAGTGDGDPGDSFRDELASALALPNWPGFPDGSRKVYRAAPWPSAMPTGHQRQPVVLVDADSRLSPAYTVFGQVTPAGLARPRPDRRRGCGSGAIRDSRRTALRRCGRDHAGQDVGC